MEKKELVLPNIMFGNVVRRRRFSGFLFPHIFALDETKLNRALIFTALAIDFHCPCRKYRPQSFVFL